MRFVFVLTSLCCTFRNTTEQKAAKEAKKKKEKEDAEKEVERQQKQVERLHNLISDRDPRVSTAAAEFCFLWPIVKKTSL